MFTPIGLDLSLTSTGLSVGNIREVIKSKNKGPERLYDISKRIIEIVSNINKPVAIIEGYAFASRNSQAHAIVELGGVVRLALWHNNTPYIEVPPTCRAKFATGKGNASKNEVISAISAKTGIVWGNPGADDKCDAWILEEMAFAYLKKPRYFWPETNMSALAKIDWTLLEGM
jgi:Holliday junction resolvasome RuvABC endonuclease subunit